MVLSRLQRRRLYSLLDKLVLHANRKLGIMPEEELRTDDWRGIDEQAQLSVVRKLWGDPGIILDYAAQNPDGLSEGELAVLRDWADGLTGAFIVDVFPDGKVRFIAGGCAFDVVGISQEPATLLGYQLPSVVQTTLIPFDGIIVFAGGMGILPIDIDDDRLDDIDTQVQDICKHETFVGEGAHLLQMAEVIREKDLITDASEMLDKLQEAMKDFPWEKWETAPGVSYMQPSVERSAADAADDFDDFDDWDEDLSPEDFEQHPGPLAGLRGEERERAIEDYLAESGDFADLADVLDEECLEGGVESSLEALLERDEPYEVRKLARLMGVPGAFDLSAAEYPAAIARHFFDEGAIQDILNETSDRQVQALRDLAARGGRWEVPVDELESLSGLPARQAGMCYPFREGEVFVYIMPNEMVKLSAMLDWGGAMARYRRYRDLVSIADALVELRGIVSLEDFHEQYRTWADAPYETQGEAFDRLVQAAGEQFADFGLFYDEDGKGHYLVHSALLELRDIETGTGRHPWLIEPITKGTFEGPLEDVRKSQGTKKPRPLSRKILDAGTVLSWQLDQDAAQAFVSYLDEHVPAGYDGYTFADDVMYLLVQAILFGVEDGDVDVLFDSLESMLFVPRSDQIQEILDLWAELADTQPSWRNNGWSKRELADLAAR